MYLYVCVPIRPKGLERVGTSLAGRSALPRGAGSVLTGPPAGLELQLSMGPKRAQPKPGPELPVADRVRRLQADGGLSSPGSRDAPLRPDRAGLRHGGRGEELPGATV